MVTRINGLSNEFLIHPGETLKEVLESSKLTQVSLATRVGSTEKTISQIINGEAPITPDMALKLEKIFNLKASFWINLQSIYDEGKSRIKEYESISKEEENILYKLPYKYLIDNNFIKDSKDERLLILRLRKFFKISDLRIIPSICNREFLFRKTKNVENPYALATLLRVCEITTDDLDVGTYSVRKLKENLNNIKSLVRLNDKDIVIELKKIFSECGIAFSLIKQIKGAPVQGLVFNKNGKTRLCLTFRQKYSDVFWFSLFHEIGHLINKVNNSILLNDDNEEKRADEFSRNYLIDSEKYEAFISKEINKESIINYSNENDIIPSILVGRLQYDKIIKHNQFNELRSKYEYKNLI